MNRIDRISDEVKRVLASEIRSLKDPRISGLVSITRCEVTGDLRYAKVFVSVYGDEEQAKNVMRGLKSAAGFLRRAVFSKIELRYAPEFLFERDASIVEGAHITKLLRELRDKEDKG